MYPQLIYEIKADPKIFDHQLNPVLSRNVDYPKFLLGFQHFIHQSKTKLVITDEFKGKKKVYLIMNRFEIDIDDYDDTIKNVMSKQFPDQEISNRSFYKMWELCFMFDINKSGMNVVQLGTDNSMIQAVMLFRKKYMNPKGDKYYGLALENGSKIKSKKIGKITLETSIGKNKADLIIANETISGPNLILQEQDMFKLILEEIIGAIMIQEKGGHFICKIFETYTGISTKLILCLANFYDKVYITKPLTSRHTTSEKFLVCMGYKSGKNIDIFSTILSLLNKNKSKNLVEIFPEYEFDKLVRSSFIVSNIKLSNLQFININEIVGFIKKQNYRGDEYRKRRELQIEATGYWLKTFLPDGKEYEELRKQIQLTLDNNKAIINKLSEQIK